jgi:hypothetical protein
MAEKTIEASPFNWRTLSCAALLAFAVSILIAVCQADTALFLYLFLVGPILILFSIALLVYTIFGKGRQKRLTLLSVLVTVWVISVSMFMYQTQVRTTARWLVWSQNYKHKVLAEPVPADREFRHVEWDGWGWGGEDTSVYLVFDPQDSLASAASVHQPGKFDGIPCLVPEVSRLESQWYAVRFYTDENWDSCKQSNTVR